LLLLALLWVFNLDVDLLVVFGVLGTTVDISVIRMSSLTDLSCLLIIGIDSSVLILSLIESLGSFGLVLVLVLILVSLSVSIFAGYCYWDFDWSSWILGVVIVWFAIFNSFEIP